MPSDIEAELIDATKAKAKKSEERQVFLHRLVDAVQDLDDDTWKGLSSESQEWVNDQAKAIKTHGEDAELGEFPDADDDEGEDEGVGTEAEEVEDGEVEGTGEDDEEESTETEEEDPVSDDDEKEVKTPAKRKPAAKKAAKPAEKKPAKAAPKEKAPKVAAGPKAGGIKVAIKKAVFKNPSISVDELLDKLGKGGVKPSKLTVSAIRSEFRHSLFVLRDLEALKGDVKL